MHIFFSNKLIFWSNEGNDYLEYEQFNDYINDWCELRPTSSINWTDHYSANFYATHSFNPTYFKIEKEDNVYYFFVEDIVFDGNRGRQIFLKMDFYYTYVEKLIKILKQKNPDVIFKRKHANRFFESGGLKYIDIENKNSYLNNIPSYLTQYGEYKMPVDKKRVRLAPQKKLLYNPAWNVHPNHSDPSQPQIDAYTEIDDNDYLVEEGQPYGGNYVYLKVKKPPKVCLGSGDNFNYINQLQVLYVPVKRYNDILGSPQSIGSNTYAKLYRWPADYTIGLVQTFVRPTDFAYASTVSQQYDQRVSINPPQPNTVWAGDSSIVLFGDIETIIKGKSIGFDEKPLANIDKPYNIKNYTNEIFLYLDPFLHYTVNDENKIVLNPLLTKQNKFTNYEIKIKYNVTTDFYVKLDETYSINLNTYYVKNAFKLSKELPWSGDVYNSYLNNNINAINTGLAIQKRQAGINMGFGFITAPFAGLGGPMAGFGHIKSLIESEFNLKAAYQQVEAKKADAANKPDTMLDTYGIGATAKNFEACLLIKYDLPEYYKKLVFSDFYFNGYAFNGVTKFNDYDNRINFNYFEIENAFQLANQYLKLPKQILNDIATKIGNGIRLWKTQEFDYSMNLDNQENSYVE